MGRPAEIPFDSIENAHMYIRLLGETVAEARSDIDREVALAEEQKSDRRIQALRMVVYHLEKLERHLSCSGRALNDLKMLRRLLFDEKQAAKDKPSSQLVTAS